MLGQGSGYQVVEVVLDEADGAKSVGYPCSAHEADQRRRQDFASILRASVAELGAKPCRRLQMALGLAVAVQRNTLGAFRMTDIPCGMMAWSVS